MDEAGEGTFVPPSLETPPALSAIDRMAFKKAANELLARQRESLKLYVPLPVIKKFHADTRGERLLRGSNRAGKTLGAAVDIAWAVTGQHPYIPFPAENGRCAIVGLDGRHHGEVIYPKLFRAGAFKIIRDEETREWRAFDPTLDRERAREARPAPPLIPSRYVREIAWDEKKRNIPAKITLSNGWELTFFSSKGQPPNGIDIDILWIDEEIENEAWWPEMVARLLDRCGRAMWSATPQVASEHLWNLHVRADDEPAMVGEHVALLEDNPHIPETEKVKFASRIVSDEERRVRIKGEFALTGFKIYPNFSMLTHGRNLEGPLSRDWSRFVIVDPGRQVCAVLFGAVPPPHHEPCILLYDELYLKGCDAEMLGRSIASKMDGVLPETFLIDSHAGRVTEMGSGLTIEAQYAAALVKHGVKAGNGIMQFVWGADDPKAGILAVHETLRVRETGRPTLQVVRGRLPHFEWEISRYHYRRVNKLITDEPEKKNDHLMDCLRYLVTFGPRWKRPVKSQSRDTLMSRSVLALKAKIDRKKKAEGSSGGVRLG